jgi:hypothetical protein
MVFTIRGYPSTENAGKLYDMQRQKVEISFEPPDADYEPPLFGDEEDEDEDEDEAEEA